MRAGANKLRSNGEEIFFICKVHNSEKYSDIISDNNRSHFKDYDEDEKNSWQNNQSLKSIRNMKDERFDYTELIEEWDLNIVKRSSKMFRYALHSF